MRRNLGENNLRERDRRCQRHAYRCNKRWGRRVQRGKGGTGRAYTGGGIPIIVAITVIEGENSVARAAKMANPMCVSRLLRAKQQQDANKSEQRRGTSVHGKTLEH